jgi:hypothetical protein
VRVVEVVRRAHREVVHALALDAPPELLEVPVEALDLGEEAHVEAVLVEEPDGVLRVHRGHHAAAGVANGAQVPGRCSRPRP